MVSVRPGDFLLWCYILDPAFNSDVNFLKVFQLKDPLCVRLGTRTFIFRCVVHLLEKLHASPACVKAGNTWKVKCNDGCAHTGKEKKTSILIDSYIASEPKTTTTEKKYATEGWAGVSCDCENKVNF